MLNSNVLISLRYMLQINNSKVVEICALSGRVITTAQVREFLREEEDPEVEGCPGDVLAHFLDGLIIFKRGVEDCKSPRPLELPISNNLVIKKLRVAFELREDDMLEIMASAGFEFGKPELSGILRKRGHRNYREAGDQVLRNFLKGLTMRVQGKEK
jgi:uncharacterized protein YehS (DUF1456 family)